MSMAPGFDPNYYLSVNTDVAQAGIDPWQHYLDYGRNEGRIINANQHAYDMGLADFDAQGYTDTNADVAAAVSAGVFQNPLEHYALHGQSEGRLFAEPEPVNPFEDQFADWNNQFQQMYSTLNDAASQFSSGLQQQQQAQQQSYNDAAQQMMQQFQQMQQMQGVGTYSPTGQNTSQYTAQNWNNPFNQTSTLPAQYQANTGNAQNGFAPNWQQSNPFNLPTY